MTKPDYSNDKDFQAALAKPDHKKFCVLPFTHMATTTQGKQTRLDNRCQRRTLQRCNTQHRRNMEQRVYARYTFAVVKR